MSGINIGQGAQEFQRLFLPTLLASREAHRYSFSVISSAIKEQIQNAYRDWLSGRGFKARRGQRDMIASLARLLVDADQRLGVYEAGTGTGKTLAYCLASIPLAQSLGKKVVIATATIALQEQVVYKDLPDVLEHTNLKFSMILAKGRQRYVCLKRLDDQLTGRHAETMALFEVADAEGIELYGHLLDAFANRTWNGERDTWATEIDFATWRPVTNDHRGCTNNRCSFFKQCPFFKARSGLEAADVIVANHDLVLADLNLGGGAVLSDPAETIYILDEAHHLPSKTRQHFGFQGSVGGTSAWLDAASTSLGSMAQRFARPSELVQLAEAVSADAHLARDALDTLALAIAGMPFEKRDEALETYRLPHGLVPDDLAVACDNVHAYVATVSRDIDACNNLLKEVFDGERVWDNAFEAEDWLPVVGQLQLRGTSLTELYADYARGEPQEAARWINRRPDGIELVSTPLDPGELLKNHLWRTCFGAICTSATLTVAGKFDRFTYQAGLQGIAHCERIASPFDYAKIATFAVPVMETTPRDQAAHTAEVIELLPDLLRQERSALVLFTSWRQLHAVREALEAYDFGAIKWQGTGSKQKLIESHRLDIDDGEASYLAGVQSFAEGLDLPDDYCRHVIIVKLPFSVPDDPLDQALAERTEAQGGNAFYEIAVPDAALRLVQACGRLIRHENDHGRITLLDRRIVNQRYGRLLLDSLPPFRQVLD